MFHIPAIFVFYGIAQVLHMLCTYYDHTNNINEHSKHRARQEKSSKKIGELESIIKKLEDGLEKGVETEIEKDIGMIIKKNS